MAKKRKNPAAVNLGRRGGKKRAANLTAQELSEQGRKAVTARWAKAVAKKKRDPQSADKVKESSG
jgi:hypothetical protein